MVSMADNPTNPERYICIHGHFYQPPRENPWLETVETEDSAAPYHDWNERITAECYAPNGASRIVNGDNQIIRIMNNYSRISFNFGPTLLSWLEENAPRTYRMIRDADRQSMLRYDGHGSAMAQVYNHVIMPLANTRDRITQIRWGIADFQHRFGRAPEGMWLSETAVDNETLDLLAQQGILFTILAPHQCARVRERAEITLQPVLDRLDGAGARWAETPDASVNPNHPYLVRTKEGRSITVFFYNGPQSRAIAFEGLLYNGENFAWRLARGFDPSDPTPQVAHVATDGESYGHHHRHGEMALSYALALHRRQEACQADELRPIPGPIPAHLGSGNRREHLLELCPRRRALAFRLRLQRRTPRLEPALARAPSCRSRLAPRYRRPAQRTAPPTVC